jgi:hypothetical protein
MFTPLPSQNPHTDNPSNVQLSLWTTRGSQRRACRVPEKHPNIEDEGEEEHMMRGTHDDGSQDGFIGLPHTTVSVVEPDFALDNISLGIAVGDAD